MTDDTPLHTLMIHGQDIERIQHDIKEINNQLISMRVNLVEMESRINYVIDVSNMCNNNVKSLGQQVINSIKRETSVCPYHKGLDDAINSVKARCNKMEEIFEKIESSKKTNNDYFKQRLISLITNYIDEDEEDDYCDY